MYQLSRECSIDTASTPRDFVDRFKHSLATFSNEEQFDICHQIQPLCETVTESKVICERTKSIRDQLIKVSQEFFVSRGLFEKIAGETFVISFDVELLDFHVSTFVQVNYCNLFTVSRRYDGDTEGGGITTISISDNLNEVNLFNNPQEENSPDDINDAELIPFFDRLVSKQIVFDNDTSYAEFKTFVTHVFLRDFDYL